MNTISTIGQTMATDGRSVYSAFTNPKTSEPAKEQIKGSFTNSAAEVSENIANSLAEVKAEVQELQKLADSVNGSKIQFAVNDDSGKVVVKVINSSTNEVIREIPSEDLQKLRARMDKTISLIFDEMV